MGSVFGYDDKCPECGKMTGFYDIYYKNHEEYFYCQNDKCKFGYEYKWKRDENGKLVTRDGTDNLKFTNLIMTETIHKDGVKTVKELEPSKND